MHQIRLALRSLVRTPFVTGVAILSLALGIGANAAVSSVFYQVLLQPLPAADPSSLVNLSAPGPKPGSQSSGLAGKSEMVFSHPMFRDLAKAQTSFTDIAAHVSFGANFSLNDEAFVASGAMVSGSYFSVLGLQPSIGRLLSPADDKTPGAHYVAVLSHSFWQSQLGGDPNILNQRLTINGKPWTIVGVAPEGFNGTTMGAQLKVFVPMIMRAEINPAFQDLNDRTSYWAYLFARLRPGISPEHAQLTINNVYRAILHDVEAPAQRNMSDAVRARFLTKEVLVEPGRQGQSTLHARAERPLDMLLGVSVIVLLIACANIANLLLARGANRSVEMSVRLALGASRGRLLVQLLTESLMLAVAGGLVSFLVVAWTLSALGAMLPDATAASLHLDLHASVLWTAAALSIGTGVLTGIFPALHGTRSSLISGIRAGGQVTGVRAAERFRTGLVTIQIALSMALLSAAGLFLKSIVNLGNIDLGANIENVVAFSIAPQRSGYTGERSRVLYQQIEERLSGLAGVTSVSSSVIALLAGNSSDAEVRVEGFSTDPDVDHIANFNSVGAGYFKALGIRTLAGREFGLSDGAGSARVAIVNEAFVKKFGLGNDAVGKYMGAGSGDSLTMQIIGVVKDAKYSDAKKDVPPMFFTAWAQGSIPGNVNFYARTTLPSDQLVSAIPGVIKGIDPSLPVRIRTVSRQLRDGLYIDLMITKLSATFAVLATLLTCVGLYGVLAYAVSQRTREIGLRMALGADASSIRTMVFAQVGRLLAIGGTMGVVAGLALGKTAASLLYGLEGNDPLVFAAAALLLIGVALLAAYLPARRASSVHPIQALRYE